MAKWNHADLHSIETKAVLYPEYCSTDTLERALPLQTNEKNKEFIRKEIRRRKMNKEGWGGLT